MNFCFNICNVSFLSYLPLMLCWTIWLMSIWRYFSESFQLKSIPNCIWFIFYLWLWWNCFPRGSAGKESTCNAGDLGLRSGFDPWVGKIPWRRQRLPTPVFWPGEFHGLYRPWGCKELDMTERLSLWLFDEINLDKIWDDLLSQIHSFLSPFKLLYKM